MTNNVRAILLLSAGALAMATLVAVIYTRREDPGFMEKECVKGQPLRGRIKWAYGDLPVPVYLETDVEPELGMAIMYGSREWNETAGKTIIQDPQNLHGLARSSCAAPGMPHDPAIFVKRTNSDGSKEDGEPHAHLYWDNMCRLRCVEISMPALAPKVQWPAIATHETGHALGLADSEVEDTRMFYKLRFIGDAVTENVSNAVNSYR
jgi:hypothetical protein